MSDWAVNTDQWSLFDWALLAGMGFFLWLAAFVELAVRTAPETDARPEEEG